MPKINAPPDVLLEREKTNRDIANAGWGPTLRLKLLRSPVAPGLLLAGGLGLSTLLQQIGDYLA
ncbi:hypothetical protein SAMN04488563_2231 [Jiangella alkaliphila]|uniref:Uncharacterized protein n=1 Tax=Jiangella alkaliphila TaxID=419479 RepID=A0A1H2J2V8_9ACTN|nr:hypothetical protein SAMN04488563_2231 [Jiangella alkaliphila]